jgi:hypothetical protein
LARYPRPQFIVFDNGNAGEFKKIYEITIMALKPNQQQITSNITQANAIIQRVHSYEFSMICSDHLIWKMKPIMKI